MVIPPINAQLTSGSSQSASQDTGTVGRGSINSGISAGATTWMVAAALAVLAIVAIRSR